MRCDCGVVSTGVAPAWVAVLGELGAGFEPPAYCVHAWSPTGAATPQPAASPTDPGRINETLNGTSTEPQRKLNGNLTET